MERSKKEKYSIAIVDDHEIFLRGLEALLKTQANFEVKHTFLSGKELLEKLPLEVDLLLLDVQLPDIKQVELLEKIRETHPDIPVVYLTLYRGNRYFNRLEKIGIQGYLLKDSPMEELVQALNTVLKGENYYQDRYGLNDQNTVTMPAENMHKLLSQREIEILQLVSQEYSSAQIAERLFISVSTVDTHRKNLMIKLGVENTVGLIKLAVKLKLI